MANEAQYTVHIGVIEIAVVRIIISLDTKIWYKNLALLSTGTRTPGYRNISATEYLDVMITFG